ncbi:MAG TPA: LysR family transcriptional regulator [Bacillota bacterium]|nr:LysR family transcriptional regulator [Bacillota bacterium]
MELRQIKYFIEVAKREHVTEAANALHVAQSAVSRQIFNLESELGVDLFIRQGRNIKLTPIGEMFLEHMEQAMNVIDDAKQIVSEYTDPEKGTVHIGFPSSLSTYILPSALSAFNNEYPTVQFQFKQDSYDELIEKVKKGNINMALVAPVPPTTSEVSGNIFFTEKVVALLPINHPLASAKELSLNQLKEEAFILFPEGFVLRELVTSSCKQQGFLPKVSFEGQDIDAIKGLVSAGLGISLIPEITLVDNLPRATVTVPIIEPQITRTVGIIIPNDRKLLPTEKLFYDYVTTFFQRLEKFQ